MKVYARIIHAQSKTEVTTEHEYTDSTIEDIVYHWELGNYSCDCNRELLFRRALGQPDRDCPCSSGKYFVIIKDEKGTPLFNDVPLSIMHSTPLTQKLNTPPI